MAILLWLVINAIVGAVIGERKNMVGGAIALAIFLGPIGWIIALVAEGNFRKCPFCAENVKDAAIVCPHCHRDLPKPAVAAMAVPPPASSPPPRPPSDPAQVTRRFTIAIVAVALLIAIGFAIWIWAGPPSQESGFTSTAQSPEFVRLTQTFSVHSTNGDEIKLISGTRVRVIARYENGITIEYNGGDYPIPVALTEPAK